MELLRPYGLVLDGELRLGLEVRREVRRIVEIRPHTGIPDGYVLSVPFVNAHSHLEYRGFLGRLDGLDYWDWIRELTRLKATQTPDEVESDCRIAALENRSTGVGLIGEHSDRPYAGDALAEAGIRGVIFQEVITFFERDSRGAKLAQAEANAKANRRHFEGRVILNPHALFTVDPQTLREFGASTQPISLHLAESVHERAFYERGEGPIADFYQRYSVPLDPHRRSPAAVADDLGLLKPGTQVVHGCDLDGEDIDRVASTGAFVVHCPRSNTRLGCPAAPVRELLDAGVDVGIGLDSAASSGPIDLFDEMREALAMADRRGKPLMADEVWRMATTMGARTLGFDGWDLAVGYEGPLIELHIDAAQCTEDLIARGNPEAVAWID